MYMTQLLPDAIFVWFHFWYEILILFPLFTEDNLASLCVFHFFK